MIKVMAYGFVRTRMGDTLEFGVLLEVEDASQVEAIFEILFPTARYQYSTQED